MSGETHQKPDYDWWNRRRVFGLDEAAWLCCDLEPDVGRPPIQVRNQKDRLIAAVHQEKLTCGVENKESALVRALSGPPREGTGQLFVISTALENWRLSRGGLLLWEQRVGERFPFLHPELQHTDLSSSQPKLKRHEERLHFFKAVLAELLSQEPGLKPLKLPTGYKTKLESLCCKDDNSLFTPGKNGTFHKFWQNDDRKRICRLADEDKYRP